jgi:hypothetical protein
MTHKNILHLTIWQLISKIVPATPGTDESKKILKLMNGYRFIMEHIYAPKHYYRLVKVFLNEFGNSRADDIFQFAGRKVIADKNITS